MTHGSLFSGIGGFDLAAEWMEWDNVFHCEWNDFGKKVLKYYWPKAISYDDITKTDFSVHRGRIDILSGGFPCQPYSQAGKRLGKEDDRHLWPEMLRAIREIEPSHVVGENVLGLTNWNGGLVFEEVQTDLEAEGYEVQPVLLPASGVNAPHQRQRVWFVAYSNGTEQSNNGRANSQEKREIRRDEKSDVSRELSCFGNSPDTGSSRQQTDYTVRKPKKQIISSRIDGENISPNTNNKRLQRSENIGVIGEGRKERNEQPPRHIHTNWEEFPTQSPIRGGDDGLPSQLDGITFPKWRNESIKAYGNAIVPQVAYQIFKAINQVNK